MPFRWAYIGSGIIAKTTSKQILATGRHQIASVYSPTYANAAAFAAQVGAQPCKSLAEAVDRPDVDGVYICTVNTAHYAQALECLELGKPVFLEKPFTMNAKEAKHLFAVAEERGLYLAEAMWTWHGAVAKQVRQWVREGTIGRVESAYFSYAVSTVKYYKASRLLDPAVGGGALLDIGVYPIAYCYCLFGMPDRIVCKGKMADGVDTGEAIRFEYDGGPVCDMKVSLTDWDGFSRAQLTGAAGSIKIPWFNAARKAVLRQAGRRTVFRAKTSYVQEFDAAAEDIRAGRIASEAVPPQMTLDVMALLDECLRQMQTES